MGDSNHKDGWIWSRVRMIANNEIYHIRADLQSPIVCWEGKRKWGNIAFVSILVCPSLCMEIPVLMNNINKWTKRPKTNLIILLTLTPLNRKTVLILRIRGSIILIFLSNLANQQLKPVYRASRLEKRTFGLFCSDMESLIYFIPLFLGKKI